MKVTFQLANQRYHLLPMDRTDHGIEQENRALKVLGGTKEISNSYQALDEYFLTVAELGNMIKDFCETFGINDNQNTKSDDHNQLAGSKNTRIGDNAEKLSVIFSTYNVNFNHNDNVYNTITMKVLPAKESTRFLDSVKIGQERHEQFINQNVEGDSSVWDTLKKVMLPTFVSIKKTVKNKVINKDVKVLKSLTRLLIDSL